MAALTEQQRANYQELAKLQNAGKKLTPQQMTQLTRLEGLRASGGSKSLLTAALPGVDYGPAGFGQKGTAPAPEAATTGGSDVGDMITGAKPIKDPGSVYDADVAGELDESAEQIKLGNPDYVGPTGGQTTTIGPDGKPLVKYDLSTDQQKILDQGEGLTQSGQAMAQSNLNSGNYSKPFQAQTADRQFKGNFSDDRLRIEDAVYNNLTRRFDRDQGRLVGEKEQELRNKGIPFSEDPESRWQKEMGVINESFNDRRDSAALQATQFGGTEMGNEFGMQETLIGNQFGQSQATHQQGLSDISSLSNLGTGLMGPTEKAFQAPNYDVQDPSTYVYAGKGLQNTNQDQKLAGKALDSQNALANKQLALESQKISMMNQGSGGAAPAPPPFP